MLRNEAGRRCRRRKVMMTWRRMAKRMRKRKKEKKRKKRCMNRRLELEKHFARAVVDRVRVPSPYASSRSKPCPLCFSASPPLPFACDLR
jgi:hypothetical protein